MHKSIKRFENLDSRILKILREYFVENKFKVYLSILIIIATFTIPQIPYSNIFIGPNSIWEVAFVLILIVLNINVRIGVFIVLFLFAISPFYIIISREYVAESIGNVIFFLLWYIVIKQFFKYRKNNEKNIKQN